MPSIHLDPTAELNLTAWSLATGGKEFSGLGIIRKEGDVFHVQDVFLLGVGSEVFTEFSPARQRDLPRDGLKLWFHRHPLGNGDPGPHNWSGTDENTATRAPLGAPPELVQWSVAIVLTPGGWVGRVDLHVPKSKTYHCAVEPRFPTPETVQEARSLLTPQLNDYVGELLDEYHKLVEKRYPSYRPSGLRVFSEFEFPGWNQTRFDVEDEYEELVERQEDYGSGRLSPCCAEEMEEVETGETCGVHCIAWACPGCENIYVEIRSDFPELTRYVPPAPEPRRKGKVKSRRDWRRSFDNFLGRSNKKR